MDSDRNPDNKQSSKRLILLTTLMLVAFFGLVSVYNYYQHRHDSPLSLQSREIVIVKLPVNHKE